MRLRSIELQWFRGGAAHAELPLNGRSTVVFGPNGSGKSSFVDGLEALLCRGRVDHLSHEYAGRNQENGLINTARPDGQDTSVRATLADGSSEKLTWRTGAPVHSRDGATTMGWEYRRTALRQEDLKVFITAAKREKYSAIVPLLGLSRLETMADNLHQLVAAIDRNGELQKLRGKVEEAEARRKEAFGDADDAQLRARLEELRAAYVPEKPQEGLVKTLVDVLAAINIQSGSASAEQRQATAIAEIGSSDLGKKLAKVDDWAARISDVAAPLIKERLDVLAAADRFAAADGSAVGSMHCPACGLELPVDDFRTHIADEQRRLSEAQTLYGEHRAAINEVCEEVGRLRLWASKEDLSSWRAGLPPELEAGVAYLVGITVADLRTTCGAADIAELKEKVEPLVARAVEDSKELPPEAQTLLRDLRDATALFDSFKAEAQRAGIRRGDALIGLVKAMEKEVRQEMADRARRTFEAISSDIQKYWQILQPDEAVTKVRLIIPEGNDKAIDVALQFHGKELDSPRLTLSEGRRNALGLCIFLAMANQASAADRPIVLDDVVISFDREHRNRVAPLLEQHFADRQVIVLTHDREWFFELQHMLSAKRWSFLKLLSFDSPVVGLTFADQPIDWEKAKERVRSDPEDAVANVRRMMDVSLGRIAEAIGLAVPHLRGSANDKRSTGEFILALHRTAKVCFRLKTNGSYGRHEAAVATIAQAKPQLEVWSNRSTHTFSGSETEARDLIATCEAVLSLFQCDECGSRVGLMEGNPGAQCSCGKLQWKPE